MAGLQAELIILGISGSELLSDGPQENEKTYALKPKLYTREQGVLLCFFDIGPHVGGIHINFKASKIWKTKPRFLVNQRNKCEKNRGIYWIKKKKIYNQVLFYALTLKIIQSRKQLKLLLRIKIRKSGWKHQYEVDTNRKPKTLLVESYVSGEGWAEITIEIWVPYT